MKKEILNLIRTNNTTKVLSHFPNLQDQFNPLKDKYYKLCNHIQTTYDQLKGFEGDKAKFAKMAAQYWFSPVLFVLMKGAFFVKFHSVWDYFAVAEDKEFFKVWKENQE